MGPYTLDALREETYRNGISPTDLGWTAGMPEWVPLAQVLPARTGPPPLPPSATVPYAVRSVSPQVERDPCAGRPRFGRGLFFLSLVGVCFMLAALSSVKETKDLGLLFFWCALIPVCVFRIRDVGMSGWAVLLMIVPLGNLYLWFHLLLAPRGYSITKQADGFLRAMIWVVGAIVALFVLCLLVALFTNH
jgi:hypothetical protein